MTKLDSMYKADLLNKWSNKDTFQSLSSYANDYNAQIKIGDANVILYHLCSDCPATDCKQRFYLYQQLVLKSCTKTHTLKKLFLFLAFEFYWRTLKNKYLKCKFICKAQFSIKTIQSPLYELNNKRKTKSTTNKAQEKQIQVRNISETVQHVLDNVQSKIDRIEETDLVKSSDVERSNQALVTLEELHVLT